MRTFTLAASAIVALLATTTIASAQTTVSGTTTGCFNTFAVCSGSNAFASAATYNIGASGETIQFTGTTFTGMTNPVTNAFTVGDFGSFVLTPPPSSGTPNTTFSTPFTLLFTLSSPDGATTPSTAFTLSGFVGSGSRDISYTGGSTSFTYRGGAGTITVDGGQIGVIPTTISGRVTAAGAVPEPSTWAMMICGFGMVAGTMRQRRRKIALS